MATYLNAWKWNDLINYPLPIFGTGEQPIGLIVEYQAVPEPASVVLIGVGLAALGVGRWRRSQ